MAEIEVECWRDAVHGMRPRAALEAGKAWAGYVSFMGLRRFAAEQCGDLAHECWYTERNGDPIGLILPAGTAPERFPSFACGYMTFEWIPPEAEFGCAETVVPLKYQE